MKRTSFFLAFICLTVLSFGLVQGQANEVYVSSITGFASPDTLFTAEPITFQLSADYGGLGGSPEFITGHANGFRLHSATASWTTFGGQWENSASWELTLTVVAAININPAPDKPPYLSGADTIGFGGAANPLNSPGIAMGSYNFASISTQFANSESGKTVCLDSTWYPNTGTWLWSTSAGSTNPGWGNLGPYTANFGAGGYCFKIEKRQVLKPTISNCGALVMVNFAHCDVAQIGFVGTDTNQPPVGPCDQPLSWSFPNGGTPNTTTSSSGQTVTLSFAAPAGSKSGCTTLVAIVTNSCGGGVAGDPCSVTVCWTNSCPVFTAGCNLLVPVGKGNSAQIDMDATDADACDNLSFAILSVTPAPIGGYGINAASGVITFNTDPNDAAAAPGTQYCFEVEVTDGECAVVCSTYFDVLFTEPFKICIEKTHLTIQGTHELVDVTVEAGSEEMGGFDILIAYDASALNFQTAIPGDLYGWPPGHCEWEYFNYRYSAFGNCGSICPSGKLRVIGIAETNNGAIHPVCFLLPTPFVLFTLDFLVSDDRTLECNYAPIRFCWFDCGDNTISSRTGDSLFISRDVVDFDLIGNIADPNSPWGYPTYQGAQDFDCFVDPVKRPHRFIDFCNGGIDIACAESLDARGDVNLNEIANEIADAVLFSRYFVYGLSVFTTNLQGQIAATDVNADGLALSVADLVYQIRIIVGDANPFPKLARIDASYTLDRGVLSVDAEMGAAYVVIEGSVEPTLLAENMTMKYSYDGEMNATRVLVFSMEKNQTFEGSFLNADGNVLSIEMATYEGAPVAAQLIPSNYALNQNYPNPFNPTTTISASLPVKSDYILTIHNVTGQKVAEFTGTQEAGTLEIVWDAANYASGIYFYKLTAGSFTETKRMVLLK